MVAQRFGLTSTGLKVTTLALVGAGLLLIVVNALLRVETLSLAGVAMFWIVNSITVFSAVVLLLLMWMTRSIRQFFVLAGTALVALTVQWLLVLLVWQTQDPMAISLHLVAVLFILSVAVHIAVLSRLNETDRQFQVAAASYYAYGRTIALAIIGVLLVLVTGGMVNHHNAMSACPDWPLCRGEIVPAGLTLEVILSLLHRFAVLAVGVLVAAIVLQARRDYAANKKITRWSGIVGLLFLGQVLAGSLYSLPLSPAFVSFLHLVLTALIWSSLIVVGSLHIATNKAQAALPASKTVLTGRQKAIIFFKLTKPWILVLLLITTLTAMVIAAEGLPPLSLMFFTFLGGALSAAGASVLNSYIDSDIDQLMSRTSRRATVTGLVTPQETLIFGLSLSLLSFLIFAIFVNMLSAILSTIGIIYYVFFYTLYLKRTTIHNIIIGGAAGAIPPLVGWTAVTNTLDLGAFYLFAIIFFWTPPHTWALALMVKKDYAEARIPMLPVVVGDQETTYQIFLYSILLITLTLLPVTFMLSWVYFVFALILGSRFLFLAWKLWQNYTKPVSRQLYKYSQLYLAVLFLLMAVDRVIF